jgi:hypothetical protein
VKRLSKRTCTTSDRPRYGPCDGDEADTLEVEGVGVYADVHIASDQERGDGEGEHCRGWTDAGSQTENDRLASIVQDFLNVTEFRIPLLSVLLFSSFFLEQVAQTSHQQHTQTPNPTAARWERPAFRELHDGFDEEDENGRS